MAKFPADVVFVIGALVLAVLGLLFGGWLIVDPPILLSRDILAMNPKVFPTLVLFFILLVSLIFLATESRKGSLAGNTLKEGSPQSSVALYRQVGFVGLTVGCALLLTTLGFLATMFLLMAGTSLLVGNRSSLQIFSISLVTPLSFYMIVTYMLRTQLPEADIVERTLAMIINALNT